MVVVPGKTPLKGWIATKLNYLPRLEERRKCRLLRELSCSESTPKSDGKTIRRIIVHCVTQRNIVAIVIDALGRRDGQLPKCGTVGRGEILR